MERDIERWITVNGKHIPIYADEPDDSKQKENQIKQNEEEADQKNNEYQEWDDKRARKEYKKYDYDVTSKEWKDETMYIGGRYSGYINNALYTGKMKQKTMVDGIKDMSPYIEAMDRSMRPLSDNVELSRSITYNNWKNSVGVDIDAIQKITEAGDTNYSALDRVIGKSFTPKGYLSTSYNENQNATVGGQVLLKLRTPKGKKAIVTANKLESEVILERGTKYTITGYKIRPVAGARKQIVFYADVERS